VVVVAAVVVALAAVVRAAARAYRGDHGADLAADAQPRQD
jgi:hypothetical protein